MKKTGARDKLRIWFSLIFYPKQNLLPLGYCAPKSIDCGTAVRRYSIRYLLIIFTSLKLDN